ncbi:hypothetical protein [Brachyspira sp.]|uniref:hypothetical protein n=1 Tax=Brachyspira sp. TaxID=1977261 RepID=UPI003D7DA8D9
MSQLLKEDTIFEKAMKKYNYFTDNKDLLNEYDKREAYLFYQSSLMRGSRKDGFEEGIKEGEKNKTILLAKSMKKENIDIKTIKRITGLTIKEIEKL